MKQHRVQYFYTKYIFLLVFGLTFMSYADAQTAQNLTDKLAENSKVKNGRFSFYAKNLSTNKTIAEKNKEQRMIPASSMKLLTGYAALDLFGPDYRFDTHIGYTGYIDSQKVLHGDIIIIGVGDPVLGSDYFENQYNSSSMLDNWAEQVWNSGIREIKGRVISDASIYKDEPVPADWVWEDIGNYYGTGAYALSYKENKYNIFLNSKSEAGHSVTIDDSSELIEGITYKSLAKGENISSDQVFVYSPPYADYAVLRGKMPVNKNKFKIKAAMPDPPLMLARKFHEAIRSKKIPISGGATTIRKIEMESKNQPFDYSAKVIDVASSPKLIDIVNYMNLKSNNLIAELLVRHISYLKGDFSGSTDNGTEVIENWLVKKGIGNAGLRMKDGSGLSYTNLVTSKWFVNLLTSMSKESWFKSVKDGLPTAGKSGSMRRVGKGTVIEGKMFAKTGYLNGARAYCGFLDNAKGEIIVFSILSNDYAFSASEMRKEMAKLLVALY